MALLLLFHFSPDIKTQFHKFEFKASSAERPLN